MDSSDTGLPHVVLVVDDDPSDLTLMERALGKAGYAVQTASNYHQALSILQKLTPAVLVFDVAMPGMSGFELCSALKDDDRLRNIPVVFVSGCYSAEDSRIGNVVGGAFFVQKAKGWDNLLSAVSLICGSKERSTSLYNSASAARFPEKRSATRYALVTRVAITHPDRREANHGTNFRHQLHRLSNRGFKFIPAEKSRPATYRSERPNI